MHWYDEYANLIAWISLSVTIIWNFINSWITYSRGRVHLKLRSTTSFLDNTNTPLPTWYIINVSDFNVFIQDIGFSYRRSFPFFRKFFRKRKGVSAIPVQSPILTLCPERLAPKQNQFISLPIRLDSRESIALAAPNREGIESAQKEGLHYMYITTSCGHTCIVKIEI